MKKDSTADRYDRVATASPINADAARAFSMRGEGDLVPTATRVAYDAPPPTFRPPPGKEHYPGKRYGKLRVIGYIGSTQKRGSRWLVRCLCGSYEARAGSAVERASPQDQCARCYTISYAQKAAKRQAYFDRHGRWPEDSENEKGSTAATL